MRKRPYAYQFPPLKKVVQRICIDKSTCVLITKELNVFYYLLDIDGEIGFYAALCERHNIKPEREI